MMAAGFALLPVITTGAAETDSPAIAPTEHIELFNGKDFSGWTFFMKGNANPTETWSVADGVIKCSGKPVGYARTEKDYRDYKLTVEYRLVSAQPHADNTGVIVHITGEDKVWPKTVECQGMHNKQGDFWMQGGATCKDHEGEDSKSRHVPLQGPSTEKPVGEWNTHEIICSGNSIKFYVNGKLMNEIQDCNVSSGKIGLQSEGAPIEVRKVSLDPAPAK